MALREEPPTGFVRGLVVESKGEHAGTLDLKHGGITIVTSIARARAIAAGATVKDTLGRLRAAVAAETLSQTSGDDLAEAFRFLLDLRLRHQVAQIRAGPPADDFVDPQRARHDRASGPAGGVPLDPREQHVLALELDLR